MTETCDELNIDRALERHNQCGQIMHGNPAPGLEFRVIGVEVDVLVLALEAHHKPFLPLAAITAAPDPADQLRRQFISQPVLGFGDDRRLVRADLLAQLPKYGGLWLLPWINAA